MYGLLRSTAGRRVANTTTRGKLRRIAVALSNNTNLRRIVKYAGSSHWYKWRKPSSSKDGHGY